MLQVLAPVSEDYLLSHRLHSTATPAMIGYDWL